MAAVTSINAYPPPPSRRDGALLSVGGSDGENRIGAILSVDPADFINSIGMALATGAGILLTPTSDGGALGVHIYAGTLRQKHYVASAGELTKWLEAVRDYAEAKLAGSPVVVPKSPLRRS